MEVITPLKMEVITLKKRNMVSENLKRLALNRGSHGKLPMKCHLNCDHWVSGGERWGSREVNVAAGREGWIEKGSR